MGEAKTDLLKMIPLYDRLHLKTLAWLSSFPLYPITCIYCIQVTIIFNFHWLIRIHPVVYSENIRNNIK